LQIYVKEIFAKDLRIQSLQAEFDILREQLKTSVYAPECSDCAWQFPDVSAEVGVSNIAGDADIDCTDRATEMKHDQQSRQLSVDDAGEKHDHVASSKTFEEYLRTVVQQLERQQNVMDADHSKLKALDDQVATLKGLETILAIRLKKAPQKSLLPTIILNTPAEAGDQRFDEIMDDDEVLLRLFYEVDTKGNGKISMEELSETPLLQTKENTEMRRVLQRALGCDLQALEEALAPLAVEDLVLYMQQGLDCDASDKTAVVKTIFDAIGPSWPAVSSETDQAAGVPGKGVTRVATRADFCRFIAGADAQVENSPLGKTLAKLAAVLPVDEQIDFLALKESARKVPRVVAQRLQWVRTMGLDAALARHLPPGTLDDG
jgi:hypothetical protein